MDTERVEQWISFSLLGLSLLGFVVTFPLWLTGRISDRAMLGLTLVLSWAALWFAAYVAIQEARHARQARREG